MNEWVRPVGGGVVRTVLQALFTLSHILGFVVSSYWKGGARLGGFFLDDRVVKCPSGTNVLPLRGYA